MESDSAHSAVDVSYKQQTTKINKVKLGWRQSLFKGWRPSLLGRRPSLPKALFSFKLMETK